MKKACIITWYKVPNHGAFLQAYALKKVLESFHFTVYFYDYERKMFKHDYYRCITHPFKTIRTLKTPKLVFDKFNKQKEQIFEKYIHEEFKIADRSNCYDLCVIGSDEIFSCKERINDFQFGNGINADIKISYAASFGETSYRHILFYGYRHKIKKYLSYLTDVSVRDDNSKAIVSLICNKTASLCVDPVILYGFQREQSMYQKDSLDAILFYSYEDHVVNQEIITEIQEFAKTMHLKTISLGYQHDWCDENINCTPWEFIEYFVKCKYVITTTFHGTVFSLLFEKYVGVIIQNNANKLLDLLKRCDATSNLIHCRGDVRKIFGTKLSRQEKLNVLRKDSLNYVERYLI